MIPRGELLEGPEIIRYRGLVARANYLAQDRGDIAYATKELSRKMSSPTDVDMKRMVRLGRYLKWRPRVTMWFKKQPREMILKAYSDTDWAGCKRTRRSTTGGYLARGTHVLKTWCRTQAIVALSSGEAELYGIVRASAEVLGGISLLTGMDESVGGCVLGDASAALGIIGRQGTGKLRHIQTNHLWVQDQAVRGNIDYQKVPGKQNGADLFTKALSGEDILNHMARLSCTFGDGQETGNDVKNVDMLANLEKTVEKARRQIDPNGSASKWVRMDLGAKHWKTTAKQGPEWGTVLGRISIDMKNNRVLKSEKAKDILRCQEHEPIPQGATYLLTVLLYSCRNPVSKDSGMA